MRDDNLDPLLDLSCVPGFPFRRIHTRPQDCRTDSFIAENPLKPCRDVVLLCVHGKHLTATPFGKFLFDLLDQSAFFGMQALFRKISGFGNDESDFAPELRIELGAVQSSETIGMVWI